MKKASIYLTATLTLSALIAAGLTINNNGGPLIFAARASSPVAYKHYNAISADENEHGCKEFWVDCSDYSYYFEAPTSGSIAEGGDIKDNHSFDWDGMDVLDERYIPSISKQKEWGMIPVLDSVNNKITYGLYPQSLVTDVDTLAALEALPESAIQEETGYYYYNGSFYQNCLGDKCDNDNHFANGEKVVDGTKYWFLCEKISWVIMENSGSTYTIYSEKAIHAGIT